MPPADFNSTPEAIWRSLQTVVSQQESLLQGQQNMLNRQQAQLDSMQEQLGMLTEVATKLAVMEERRGEDKATIAKLEARVDKISDRITEKLPQYDGLLETYKSVNNKLWAAIAAAVIGVILGAVKLGIISGG